MVSRRRYSPLDGKLEAGIIDVEVKHCESVARIMSARVRTYLTKSIMKKHKLIFWDVIA
jgi:hypothetical protein